MAHASAASETTATVEKYASKTAEEAAAANQEKVATEKMSNKASYNCDQCEYSNTKEKGAEATKASEKHSNEVSLRHPDAPG